MIRGRALQLSGTGCIAHVGGWGLRDQESNMNLGPCSFSFSRIITLSGAGCKQNHFADFCGDPPILTLAHES